MRLNSNQMLALRLPSITAPSIRYLSVINNDYGKRKNHRMLLVQEWLGHADIATTHLCDRRRSQPRENYDLEGGVLNGLEAGIQSGDVSRCRCVQADTVLSTFAQRGSLLLRLT